MRAFAPNGSPIMGTLEVVSARAEITDDSFERDKDGNVTFDWLGATTVFWDDQETVIRDDKPVFLAEDGTEWTSDQIVLRDEVEDDAA